MTRQSSTQAQSGPRNTVGGLQQILIDLGGGSCEITLSERKRIKETVSLPLGAVRLTEQFLSADPPSPEGLAQMRQLIARELRRARRRIRRGSPPAGCRWAGGSGCLRSGTGTRPSRR